MLLFIELDTSNFGYLPIFVLVNCAKFETGLTNLLFVIWHLIFFGFYESMQYFTYKISCFSNLAQTLHSLSNVKNKQLAKM